MERAGLAGDCHHGGGTGEMNSIGFHAHADAFCDPGIIAIRGFSRRPGRVLKAKSLIIESVDENASEGIIVEPIAYTTRHDAQKLMDDLWHCGIRPSEG